MEQIAFKMELQSGQRELYQKRHDEIWPEMVELIQEAGMRNYSIFRHGLNLFGYFETDDLERMISILNQSEVNKRWGEYMTPIMKIEVDTQISFPFLLPLQWHMD